MGEAMNEAAFPATCFVHWPSGPVACCERHAFGLITLSAHLGGHVIATPLEQPAECANCRNEARQALTGAPDHE